MRRSWVWGLVLLVTPGCFLIEPEVEYLSNLELMERVCESAGVHLDREPWRPFHAQVLDDFVLLDFRGESVPGDRVTVRRFSLKSTEQKPESLVDVESLMDVLEERREGIERLAAGTDALERGALHWIVYRFDSPIRDEEGQPYIARGVAATLETLYRGEPVVYWLTFDNWGDRPTLTRESLDPVLAALER